MTTRRTRLSLYKIKKKYREVKRNVLKKISKLKLDRTFYFCTTMILTLLVIIVFVRPVKPAMYEVEIKSVDNYTVQVTSEAVIKNISFNHIHFVCAEEEKNILKGNELYIYRRFRYEVQRV